MMVSAPAIISDLLELLDSEVIKFAEFLELLAHVHGHKTIVRLVADSLRCEALLQFLAKTGLEHRVSDFCLRAEFSTGLGDTFQRVDPSRSLDADFVVFVGAPAMTAEAHAMELQGADAGSCARAYGYPACCATSYLGVQEGTPWVVPFLEGLAPVSWHDWRMNRLASLFPPYLTVIPDFFPCSIRCPSTGALSLEYEQLLLSVGLSELRDLVAAELRRPLLVHDGWIYRFERIEELSASGFRDVRRVSSVAIDSAPRQARLSIRGLSVVHEQVELLLAEESGSQRTVTADGPLLLFAP